MYYEAFHIFLNVIFGEIWFYTLHRIMHSKHFYKYHKMHHEMKETLGLFALYAHPFDAIIVNLGSIYYYNFQHFKYTWLEHMQP
jgi:methylsterol monooxygenase